MSISENSEDILGERALEAIAMILGNEGKNFPDVREHASRVERHSAALAAAIGMSRAAVSRVRLAARLHDVGKMVIPVSILRKPGRLNAEERAVMETHASKGAELLAAVPDMPIDIVDTARYHHERYDGHGYYGLSGEDIPFTARIVAVADVHDALVSARDYKPAMSEGKALSIMAEDNLDSRLGRRAFDPYLLRSFVSMRLASAPHGEFSEEQRLFLDAFAKSDPMSDLSPEAPVEIDIDGERRVLDADGNVTARFDAAHEPLDIPRSDIAFG